MRRTTRPESPPQPRPLHGPEARLELEPLAIGAATLRVAGTWSNATVPRLWPRVDEIFEERDFSRLVLEASGLRTLDGAGMALLLRLKGRAQEEGVSLEWRGLAPDYQRWLDRFDPRHYQVVEPERSRCVPLPEQVGRVTARLWHDLREEVSFLGELSDALLRACLRPRRIRWRDLWLAAERAGTDALPIVALISALVGLVLAFQAAMAMRPYGAEIYVAMLVTIAMLRELGPLMAAIILSGRSGGAFAAEIGTMKVNDEVAALSTMGLRPVPFLAVPRVLGLVFMIPFLTLFADVTGILGGAVVFLSFEYPVSTYFTQAIDAAEPRHIASGLVKSVFFGFIIGGVGCLRGLQALRGPSAVGISTTSAVVTSILLIVITDAVMGVIFYYLQF